MADADKITRIGDDLYFKHHKVGTLTIGIGGIRSLLEEYIEDLDERSYEDGKKDGHKEAKDTLDEEYQQGIDEGKLQVTEAEKERARTEGYRAGFDEAELRVKNQFEAKGFKAGLLTSKEILNEYLNEKAVSLKSIIRRIEQEMR